MAVCTEERGDFQNKDTRIYGCRLFFCFFYDQIQYDFVVKLNKEREGQHIYGNILMFECSRELCN